MDSEGAWDKGGNQRYFDGTLARLKNRKTEGVGLAVILSVVTK